MLVLSRKEGERVLIGDDIRITVVRISPKSIRLGIEAPSDKQIVREEIILANENKDITDEEVVVLKQG
ncbi:MAG: carbon storage regulator [Thermoguttaceae bacterium]